jgi:predicted dinucleotide-binding enzyme
MVARILVVGGYGLIGSTVARQIRKVTAEAELILAGRNPDKGAALARELGRAITAHLDVEAANGLDALDAVDLIVSALYDPANALIEAALTRSIAHIGITTKADDVAPITAAALRLPPKRPIVLSGHSMAGAATIVAQMAAQRFSHIDSIALAALYDERDTVGPMTASDAEMLVSRALLREGGKWKWLDGRQHGRQVRLANGDVLDAYPAGLLDAASLAAITGASDVRFDLAQGLSLGTRAGRAASSDVYIDIAGILRTGAPGKQRTILSDPGGLAHLTALGVVVAAECVLGLGGRAPASGGLHLPETLVEPAAAVARFEQFGVRITHETGGVL